LGGDHACAFTFGMLPARYSGFLWTLIPSLLFSPTTYGAPSEGLPSAASFYVQSLPDLHQNETRPLHIYAGHLPSDPNAANVPATEVTAHLYFVLVKARRTADKERILFWLNGGPGCSSFDGLMMEVGPWRIDGKGGLKTVEGGWEEYTTMVYVDQPAGTGFSYTSSNHYDHELPESADHFVEFLRNFYQVFPEYHVYDTYLGGESFAGQYIPYIANAILESNLGIPFRGAAIGNGWMDAQTQYPSFLPYAVKQGLVEENSEDWKRGKDITDRCIADVERLQATGIEPVHTNLCETVMQTVLEHKRQRVNGEMRCVNMYDVRLDDLDPACGMNWPPDLVDIGSYLHRPDVVRAIHATDGPSWTECRGIIHVAFTTLKSNSSVTVIPKVLERVPIMLFAGDQDMICNHVGIEMMIQNMKWNGETGLGTTQTQSWSVNDAPAGTWVTSRNLTYVKLFNASHMAGYDVPHVTHDMILRFMGVNFSAITEGSAKIPSSVGNDNKPMPIMLDEKPSSTGGPSKSPEQDKAMWEAYYNAGSAALVLVIIGVLIGGFLWWRFRKGGGRRSLGGLSLPISTRERDEESIPLTTNGHGNGEDDEQFRQRLGNGKGKERASLTPHEEIFGVGDDEDDESRSPRQ